MNEKIKQELEKRNIKQSDLAKAVGVSQAFISGIINGYKMPGVPLLKRIADYLGVKIDELVD